MAPIRALEHNFATVGLGASGKRIKAPHLDDIFSVGRASIGPLIIIAARVNADHLPPNVRIEAIRIMTSRTRLAPSITNLRANIGVVAIRWAVAISIFNGAIIAATTIRGVGTSTPVGHASGATDFVRSEMESGSTLNFGTIHGPGGNLLGRGIFPMAILLFIFATG